MDEPHATHLDPDPVVAVLRWPAEDARRRRLAGQEVPRLLLLSEDEEPPAPLDDLEDWVRAPLSPADLAVRTELLRRRAAQRTGAPVLDGDGLLRFRGGWVVIPDAQLPVVDLLVRRFRSLVRTDELVAAYGAPSRKTVSTVVFRLRGRVAEVGLDLQVVRRRGVILEA